MFFDDEGLGFIQKRNLWETYFSGDLKSTWIVLKASQWLDFDSSELSKFIYEKKLFDRTIAVVSAESLRKGILSDSEKPGVKLSRTISWERTIEDLLSAWRNERFGEISKCVCVLIRFGLEGAVLLSREQDKIPSFLIFDRARIENEYAPDNILGSFSGITTVFTCSVIQSIVKGLPGASELNPIGTLCDGEAVKQALVCCRRYFDQGYGPSKATIKKYSNLQLPISQIFRTGSISKLANDGRHTFEMVTICSASNVAKLPSSAHYRRNSGRKAKRASRAWSLLMEGINQKSEGQVLPVKEGVLYSEDHRRCVSPLYQAIVLARSIVVNGFDAGVRESTLPFPYARIGQLVSIDREEIENFRSCRNILAEYVNTQSRRTPLSIAVFGPPGCGKSFGVSQIAQSVAGNSIDEFVFNMAQFSTFADVTRLLLQVRNSAIADKLPLVFFDEFDSQIDAAPLGWLKYFLSPMHDGQFQHQNELLSIGRAIFVFAGGLAASHKQFMDPQTWAKLGVDATGKNVFREAKARTSTAG